MEQDVVIEVKGLVKTFGKKAVLNEMYPKVWTDISLRLEGIFHEVDV